MVTIKMTINKRENQRIWEQREKGVVRLELNHTLEFVCESGIFQNDY